MEKTATNVAVAVKLCAKIQQQTAQVVAVVAAVHTQTAVMDVHTQTAAADAAQTAMATAVPTAQAAVVQMVTTAVP